MSTYTVADGQSQTFSFTPVPVRFGGGQGDSINVSGVASIDASATGYENLSVNLASNTHLTAGIHFKSQNSLGVQGDASTSVTFTGISDFAAAASAFIQPDVLGTGTLNVGPDGELEFARSVADGITVDLNSAAGSLAILILEQPGAFKGTVNFTDGLVALRGLSTATDYDVTNGVLTVYGGPSDQVLDTLRIADSSPEKAGLSVSLNNGEVDVTEQTGSGPFNGGTALAQHVAPPPVTQPPAIPVSQAPFLVATGGQSGPQGGTAYTGPVQGVELQFIEITPKSLIVDALVPNVFIHTGSGDDAVELRGGTNVVDCGTGSNFVTCASGFDTVFLDARNVPATNSAAGPVPGAIWDTVQAFGTADAVSIFGIGPGAALNWQRNEGAVGHTGLTLHANLANGSEASLTLAGIDNPSHLSLSYGNTGGAAYLYIKSA